MAITFALDSFGLFRLPGGWFYDFGFFLRGEQSPRSPIILIAIDEDSVRKHGRFTRHDYSLLLESLSSQAVSVIALDILLDTPGGHGDIDLAKEISDSGNVVLAGHFDLKRTQLGDQETWRPPLGIFQRPASGIGFTNLPQDGDGIIRRATLARTLGQDVIPSLTAEVTRVHRQQNPSIQSDRPLLINFRGGPNTFETLPAHQLLTDPSDHETNRLSGKIALVGYTTTAEKDLFSTPYTRSLDPAERGLLSGIELQANIIDNLLQDDFLRAATAWEERGLMALLGTLGAVLALRMSPRFGLLSLLALVILYSSIAILAMSVARVSVPGASPTAASLLTYGALLTQRTLSEEKEKRRIRGFFSGFLSSDRLETLLGHRGELWHHRKGLEATVLFVDIRGFSAMVEEMMELGKELEVVDFLNTYLNSTVEEIMNKGGTVERLMGDGLLAVFGVNVLQENHALQAIRAAQGIARNTESLQERWPSAKPLVLGIGIHSGYILEVILGSYLKYEYTIVGSVVNAAAHIQTYAKDMDLDTHTGAIILVTEDAFQRAGADSNLVGERFNFQAEGKGIKSEIVYLLKDGRGD